MAIYFNMVVDCGESEALAERIQRHFADYLLDLSPLAPVSCHTVGGCYRGTWFAGVLPRGVGYGTLPQSEGRPELTSRTHLTRIKELLYRHLAGMDGYERAYFGAEAWDTFGEEEEASMEDPWARDMIIAERLVAGRFPRADFVPFTPGYFRWLPCEPAFDLPAGWACGSDELTGNYIAEGTVPGEAGAARFWYAWGAPMWETGLPVMFPHHRAERFESTTFPLRWDDLSTPDLRITLFEVAGNLELSSSAEEPATARPVWRLLRALLETPGSGWKWFFEVAGPDATVAAARAPFVRMLLGLRRGGSLEGLAREPLSA